MSTVDLKALFSSGADETILVITVGNSFRGDDGVGPYIARNIGVPSGSLFVIDAGERPEGVLDRIPDIKPQKTIIIDAADFGGEAGEARLLPEELIQAGTLSTHMFPLRVISAIIAEDTGSEVLFLGIQGRGMAFGEGLCPEVKKTADDIIGRLSRL